MCFLTLSGQSKTHPIKIHIWDWMKFMSLWKLCVYFFSQLVCRKDDVKDWRKPQLWCADRAHGQDAILWDASWCILRQFGCPAYYRGEFQLPVVPSACFELSPYFQGILGDEDIASCIYSLDTRCKWVNSFTPLPLYSLRKRPKLHLNGRLGCPQSVRHFWACVWTFWIWYGWSKHR